MVGVVQVLGGGDEELCSFLADFVVLVKLVFRKIVVPGAGGKGGLTAVTSGLIVLREGRKVVYEAVEGRRSVWVVGVEVGPEMVDMLEG